ncbi:argonaute-like protein [Cylindrobasidium torrendii FP15055 ss-10]|uniref:Argonaute-like protein n=1 Tax=Cylindrobasidium torrendii FP15055 ss-10 TaxID=1314674 RepID=A0A0D7BA59_9AGAR|nr:argonaute-like protein [Cylindrobasidium torrendii FP15055 ss-10]
MSEYRGRGRGGAGGGGGRGGFRGGDRGRGNDRGGRGGGGRGGFQAPRVAPLPPAGPVDARLTDGSEATLVRALKTLKVNDNELPLRPDFGKLGKEVKLRANFFSVNIPETNLFEYDIVMTPSAGASNRRVKRRIFQLAEQSPEWAPLRGKVAHDHASKLISSYELPQPLTISSIEYYEEDEDPDRKNKKSYTLEFNFIQPIDTAKLLRFVKGTPSERNEDVLPILSALNLILAAHPSRAAGEGGAVLVGRNRFFTKNAAPAVSLGGGLEAWRGFYSSVRPSHHQLLVNVNVCTTAFYEPGNLATSLIAFARGSYGARFTAFAKGVRVRTHLGFVKTVKSVTDLKPSQYTFDCAELGGRVTVEQYFKKKYGKTLLHPDLPLVDVGGGNKANLLPAETCDILPNQAFKGKLSDDNTAKMITVAARPPNANASAILGAGLTELGFRSQGGSETLKNFGITVGNEMAIVPGRVLPTPSVTYQGNSSRTRVDAEKASWNLRDARFFRPGTLSNWVVLCINDNNPDDFKGPKDPDLRASVENFMAFAQTAGMVVNGFPGIIGAKPPPREFSDPTRTAATAAITAALKSRPTKPAFALVILSNSDKHIYSNIKRLCDCTLDLPTVCVQAGKFKNSNAAYNSNVLLKVNTKLGGTNHTLDQAGLKLLDGKKTMMVGIDVTHPGPGSVRGTPSIAAVVANVDEHFSQFPASMQLQESKKEMVTELAAMMQERLLAYKARNRSLPERVIVYRDGVSEGQLQTVVDEEMPAIQAAFRVFNQGNYRPKLSIIVCGKRHHTRFFPADEQGSDQKGNSKPGMVVDRGVTSVYQYDFFLQSHAGLQGTTRPTHYYVVHDDIGFKPDEIQQMTNHISYMFTRATKGVSLAAPAYYADMACERGRAYIHKLLHGVTDVNLNSATADDDVFAEAKTLWGNGVGQNMRNIMYYI